MSATPALELMLGLLDDSEALGSKEGVPPQVLPVVHHDVGSDQALLEAAFERAGGKLFRIDPTELMHPGNPSVSLVQAIEATVADTPVFDLEITQTDGQVTVASDPALTANDSSNLLLATIARLLSHDLELYPLVGLIYDVDGLDVVRKPLIWRILVNQAPPHLPKSMKTFVPIEAGGVDFDRHFAGVPSVRYVVFGDGLRKRDVEPVHMSAKVSEMVPDLDGPLVLFLGAGASASAGIPVGDSVRNAAIRRLVGDEIRNPAEDFRRWAYEHDRILASEQGLTPEQFAGRLTLERVLREEFNNLNHHGGGRKDSETVVEMTEACENAKDKLPKGREALHELLAAHPRIVVITVNFDWQIENDLDAPHRVFASTSDFEDAPDILTARMQGACEELPILKIHGTMEDPDTLVANLDDTEMGLAEPVRAALDVIFSGPSKVQWIWVGCSMRDVDVNQWMRGRDADEIYDLWVDPLPGPTIDAFIETCRPEIAGSVAMHKVSELPDIFLPVLAGRILSLAGKAD